MIRGYKIGDSVVHWSYGLGKVIAIEEKDMGGETRQYYCVEVGPLAVWVPFSENGDSPIRPPALAEEFPDFYEILQGKAEDLPDHQFMRKNLLKERLQKHTLAELCRLIRDLRGRSRVTPLNQNDSAVLQRVEANLIDEWVLSHDDISRIDAIQIMEELLAKQNPEPDTEVSQQ